MEKSREYLLLVLEGSEEGSLLGLDAGAALVVGELLVGPALVLDSASGLGLVDGVGTDEGMSLLVDLGQALGGEAGLDEAGELLLVSLLVLVLEELHVLGDVLTEDALAEDLSVELTGLDVEAGQALLGVGDGNTTIDGTLHDTEDTSTGGGAGKTGIKVGAEGAGLTVDLLDVVDLAIDLGGTLVDGGEVELGEQAAGSQQTDGVGGGVVGQADSDAEVLELMSVGRRDDVVTLDLGVDELGNDVVVGDADDEAVLGGSILVLVLVDKALTSVVVSLAICGEGEISGRGGAGRKKVEGGEGKRSEGQ